MPECVCVDVSVCIESVCVKAFFKRGEFFKGKIRLARKRGACKTRSEVVFQSDPCNLQNLKQEFFFLIKC